ncbi:MAG: hypothetical protein ACOX9E_02910 [Lentisphaeria bacterium]|jgi:hypothetical protein
MATGNRSVLVMVDSRAAAVRRDLIHGLFDALRFWGVPHEVWDVADNFPSPPAHFNSRALYVLGHDGIGQHLKDAAVQQIAAAVQGGAGWLSFDRNVDSWPAALRELAPPQRREGTAMRLSLPVGADGEHFINAGHDSSATVWELMSAMPVTQLPELRQSGWRPLLLAGDEPVLACRQVGAGRAVFWGLGLMLYREDVWGHGRFLDGLLWRSLVWATAKPFAMRAIPPYVTARVDDCHGAYSAFGYVDAFKRHGISPNLGLFIDELGPTDWAAVSQRYRAGEADFSMHAFRDDFYKARPDWRPYAVLADKPDLSNGGRETRFEGLSLDHDTGEALPLAQITENVARMDKAFAAAGIRHSKIINAHYGEVGYPVIPAFLARGACFLCNNTVPGQLYANQPMWRPAPYGLRGNNGRPGVIIDRSPSHPDLYFSSVGYPPYAGQPGGADILNGHVPFLQEAKDVRKDAAIARGVSNMFRSLDMMSFAVIMTHEERIDVISLDDWNAIIDGVVAGARRAWDLIPASREQVSVIVRRLSMTALNRVDVLPDGRLQCELTGRNDGPSPLMVWLNEGEDCRRVYLELPALDGFFRSEPMALPGR